MQSQQSSEGEQGGSVSNPAGTERKERLSALAENLVSKSTDYLKEQFDAATADYTLLQRMNQATANRYIQMLETVAGVNITMETLNSLEDGLKPYIECIKELNEISVRLEQAAYTLDNYVKELRHIAFKEAFAMDETSCRRFLSFFKLSGIHLKSEAADFLTSHVVANIGRLDTKSFAEAVINALQKMPLTSCSIDEETARKAVESLERRTLDGDDLFIISNANEIPKYLFQLETRRFVPCQKKYSLFGDADDKVDMFRERFLLVYQRLLHHELFSEEGTSGNILNKKYMIRSVGSLCAEDGILKDAVVVGVISQMKQDKFYLEDLSGHIEVDLSEATFQPGIYVEDSVVMVEGFCHDMILHVTAIGFPPIESAEQSSVHHVNLPFSSFTGKMNEFSDQQLSQMEVVNESTLFVFLSDVHLDSPEVLQALHCLFAGFAIRDPNQLTFFVFTGEFLSTYYYGAEQGRKLTSNADGFKKLGLAVSLFESLAKSARFIFVPSSQDPPTNDLLPRMPLASSVVEPFRKKVTHCILATNPCHIRYLSQRIVVFRQDIVEKMCRNCFFMPSDSNTIPEHFCKTLLAQSHLAPLPLHISPVYWCLDHSLYLYPLPDLIVCCDKYKPFTETIADCRITNPGSFAKGKFVFQVYIPSSRTVEDSIITEDQLRAWSVTGKV
ncbi:DNA polymerase epsilon subunit 2 [Trichuris trichiura]|uniref:DNA polymerase II subunit 2 n=1 Tax=Trichuris trichiura TaxID=36087 RepID=A0A077Z0X1_TRITR|nr:DNA polymerase epsilon subunit 2 [Trichuris trichiura]